MRKSNVICTLLCLVCSGALFFLHFAVFDRMLLQNPLAIGTWCAIWIINASGLCGTADGLAARPRSGIGMRLLQLLCCVIICGIPALLLKEPYDVEMWIEAAWLLMIILLYRQKNFSQPQAYVVISVMALAAVGLFLVIMHPLTALEAQLLTEQAGYTDPQRFSVKNSSGTFWDTLPDGEDITYTMPAETDPFGYYGFRAEKDGEPYCVIVSAARKQIEVQEKQGV